MRDSDSQAAEFHPDSPVQRGRDRPVLVFALAAVGAVALWSLVQSDDVEPKRPAASAPADSERSKSSDSIARPAVPAKAKAVLASYFSSDDYPSAAIRHGETGRVGFRLEINKRGRVSHCSITQSSGSKSLDRATCSILKRRPRYTAARDAEGRAVADTASGAILWQLPD